MKDSVQPDPIRSPALEKLAPQGVRHGFFTRAGGVSEGIYRGLNAGLGSGDARDRVAENRARIAASLGVVPGNLLSLYQIHSAKALTVRAAFDGERPQADALVTDRPGLALGVLSADCGPVLYADAQAGVIGAAHAGWKGALTGILESTVEAMERLGARRERIVAVLGPAIGPENYEVGPEFVARFSAESAENERYFTPSAKPGHSLFDLNRYTLDRLARAGIAAHGTGNCTYADEARFYSYRRATHRGEGDYGRQISAIVLEER
ncbi:MAG TPA: peptidoglycan editing factor PgeF [Aquamicrobium sp.]|nr:peptidoglycan editing factor PgeF [Aquamicrobium sp.]